MGELKEDLKKIETSIKELKKEANVRKQNKLRVVGNLMNEKVTKQKYKDYPTMLTDVIDKYNTLRTNSWNEFYKVVQRMIKYGK